MESNCDFFNPKKLFVMTSIHCTLIFKQQNHINLSFMVIKLRFIDVFTHDLTSCGYPEKQRDLARKGSVKNGAVGSPVNQQPKKNARTR